MTQVNVRLEIQHMTIPERIELIEMTLGLIRRDLQASRQAGHGSTDDARARLTAAAALLRHDYETDPELTVFTTLDGEDFHASG